MVFMRELCGVAMRRASYMRNEKSRASHRHTAVNWVNLTHFFHSPISRRHFSEPQTMTAIWPFRIRSLQLQNPSTWSVLKSQVCSNLLPPPLPLSLVAQRDRFANHTKKLISLLAPARCLACWHCRLWTQFAEHVEAKKKSAEKISSKRCCEREEKSDKLPEHSDLEIWRFELKSLRSALSPCY